MSQRKFMLNLKGKVAIVTGGAGSIGRVAEGMQFNDARE